MKTNLIVLIVVFVLQEVFFRAISPIPEAHWFNRASYENFYPVGFKYCPMNYTLISESSLDDFKFPMQQNLHGFRDKEFEILSNRNRVLFVGDSFVESWGSEKTISEYFEASLKQKANIEAINLGITGSNPERYLQILEDSIPLLKPNSVVLVLSANDFPTSFKNVERNKIKQTFFYNYLFVPRIFIIMSQLFDSCLPPGFSFVNMKYFQAIPQYIEKVNLSEEIRKSIYQYTFNPYMVGYLEKMESALRSGDFNNNLQLYLEKVKKICSDNSTDLFLIYIPYSANVNSSYLQYQTKLSANINSSLNLMQPEYYKMQEDLERVSKNLEIKFLDLTTIFKQAESRDTRLYWSYDGHCNYKGYQLAAESIGNLWIQSQN